METGESVWCINCGHHFDDHMLAPLPPQLESPYIFYEARQYLGCKGKGEGIQNQQVGTIKTSRFEGLSGFSTWYATPV